LFHDFFAWMQYELGKVGDGLSWSMALNGSQNLWNLFEGTHVLTLMFFAGTIWIIDLRMMGIAFRNTPFSRLNDKILPITMIAFGMMVFTGVVTFFGRQPATFYYHDMWFRLKMIFLVIAMVNILWFHFKVQTSQVTWDADPTPPRNVRISGAISMACWILIIIFGRFIAYDWYKCDKLPSDSFLYMFQECEHLYEGMDEDALEEEERLLNEDEDPLAGGGTVDPFAAPPPNPFGEPPASTQTPTEESPPDPGAPAETEAATPGEGE
jgi:hypothetical protein